MGISKIAAISTVSLVFGLASATVASAKPLCLHTPEGFVTMVFPKGKAPKAGKVTSLTGVTDGGAVVHGSAYFNAAGTSSTVSVFIATAVGGLRYSWAGDATLAGVGTADTNGDNSSDGARTFVVVDCATVTLP